MVAETLHESHITEIPLLPLRDVVVYPHMVTPLFVGRGKSIEALERAMASDKQVLLVAQKNPQQDEPQAEDLYSIGTIASILQLLKLPDGTVKVLIEGRERANIESIEEAGGFFKATVDVISSPPIE
ncbi:LON peptidase substrate-binding domain-containing protein, partial [Cellvibrio sp.]